MVDPTSLNENQNQAVCWNDGAFLVLAGSGSGKTLVLTYRIARIIEETADQHFSILGLTFTNWAAKEMQDRIGAIVPKASARTRLTTFHAFSTSLLRQHGHHLGLRPDFTVLSQDADRMAVLDEAIEKVCRQYGEVNYRSEKLLPWITRLLDRGIAGIAATAEEAIPYLQQYRVSNAEIIGGIYAHYRCLMIGNNVLDFGGLLAEALRLLREKRAVRRQLHRIYPYICADEFQDTSLVQYQILCHIVNPATRNLFVVADDQVIYQWNGASPERLKSLKRTFDMRVSYLPETYRCPPPVLDIANELIARNSGRDAGKPVLQASRQLDKSDTSLRIQEFASFNGESCWLAEDIAQRPRDTWDNCVILARTRRLLEKEYHGISSHLAVRKDEFDSEPMRWLHAMLRLANARHDQEQLRRVCRSFSMLTEVGLDADDIMADADAGEGDCLRAWWRAVRQKETSLSTETMTFLGHWVPELADRLDFRHFVENSFGWFDTLPDTGPATSNEPGEYRAEKDIWDRLVNEIAGLENREKTTLNKLLQELDLRSEMPRPPRNAVSCCTIHASKGMEFDHVYLAGLVEDQLPSWAAIRKGAHSHELQEERRACFAAVTRARQSLTLTWSRRVFGWPKQPSRFLKEMALI